MLLGNRHRVAVVPVLELVFQVAKLRAIHQVRCRAVPMVVPVARPNVTMDVLHARDLVREAVAEAVVLHHVREDATGRVPQSAAFNAQKVYCIIISL